MAHRWKKNLGISINVSPRVYWKLSQNRSCEVLSNDHIHMVGLMKQKNKSKQIAIL